MTAEIRATAASLREVFVETALKVFALAVDPAEVEEREVREVRAHGATPEGLLLHWIGECLYVHEVEGFVARAIELTVFDTAREAGGEPLRLHAFLRGEELEPGRHRPRLGLESARPARVSLETPAGGYEVRLTVET